MTERCFKNKEKKNEKKKQQPTQTAKNAFAAFRSEQTMNEVSWYLDSGASAHMTPHENKLCESKNANVSPITTANNDKMQVEKVGSACLNLNNIDIEVKDILHVPNLAVNL